ncbi:MAG: type I DNA topoisomerase [Dehalococcoidales bacterium]|nr:type I DNA topoisomerase [Dehalococcoidales bacterium]
MKSNLVIVESPAKARTLAGILGRGYRLKASLGHIRDLPRSRLGVDTEHDFTPKYVIPRDKAKLVRELKKAVKGVAAVYLATDPDREGEAIAWHLADVIGAGKTPYRRVVFHEITEPAIKRAFKHSRPIDMQLVNAQQARRILDRLVGYKLSPLLWRKVRRGLSAGRVQSVALRIIVDREREIEQFVPQEYWTIEAKLTKRDIESPPFSALLVGLADGTKLDIGSQEEAEEIKNELESAGYIVAKVKTKKVNRQPAPPFITSTLQQEAWRRFRFTAKQTMALAQQLYEGLPLGSEGNAGLITYMRTDSTHVARSAVAETRQFIAKEHGPKFLPPNARSFAGRVKGAQEAHEAIRPTKIWRQPTGIRQFLNTNQLRLYQLIWQRMVASQMAAAIFENTAVDIEARCPVSKTRYLFRSSSSVSIFPGFKIIYSESKDIEEEKKSTSLPLLEKGDLLELVELLSGQHFTQPPPRFTEATLIKSLEQRGIGRPSTYAPILSTIQEREYVLKEKGNIKPTELGMAVNGLLVRCFPDIVNVEFTARMEDELDKIAGDNMDWVQVVSNFYSPFDSDLEKAQQVDKVDLLEETVEGLCPDCDRPLVLKHGRFGKFVACSGYPDCKYTASYQIKTGARCPECGAELVGKKNKRGRTFYGCSRYPECKFATNYRPLSRPCSKCDGLLTAYRGKWAQCSKCKHKEKLEQE